MKRRIVALLCVAIGFGLAITGIVRQPQGPLTAPTLLWYLAGSVFILKGYVIIAFASLPPPGSRDL